MYELARPEAAAHFEGRRDSTLTPPRALPRRGQVEFIRLIRSDRILKVLDAKITMPEELVPRYVTATLHRRTERLLVQASGLYFRMEFPFRVKG